MKGTGDGMTLKFLLFNRCILQTGPKDKHPAHCSTAVEAQGLLIERAWTRDILLLESCRNRVLMDTKVHRRPRTSKSIL